MYRACNHLCSFIIWLIQAFFVSFYGLKLCSLHGLQVHFSLVRGARVFDWDILSTVSINVCIEHFCTFVPVAIGPLEPSWCQFIDSNRTSYRVDKYIPVRFAMHACWNEISAQQYPSTYVSSMFQHLFWYHLAHSSLLCVIFWSQTVQRTRFTSPARFAAHECSIEISCQQCPSTLVSSILAPLFQSQLAHSSLLFVILWSETVQPTWSTSTFQLRLRCTSVRMRYPVNTVH